MCFNEVCLCVCVRERERERESMCFYVCAGVHGSVSLTSKLYSLIQFSDKHTCHVIMYIYQSMCTHIHTHTHTHNHPLSLNIEPII